MAKRTQIVHERGEGGRPLCLETVKDGNLCLSDDDCGPVTCKNCLAKLTQVPTDTTFNMNTLKPAKRCCCGRVTFSDSDDPVVIFNDIQHEAIGGDRFCGPVVKHHLRDALADVARLEKRVEQLETAGLVMSAAVGDALAQYSQSFPSDFIAALANARKDFNRVALPLDPDRLDWEGVGPLEVECRCGRTYQSPALTDYAILQSVAKIACPKCGKHGPLAAIRCDWESELIGSDEVGEMEI